METITRRPATQAERQELPCDEPLGDATMHHPQVEEQENGERLVVCPQCNARMLLRTEGNHLLIQTGYRRRTMRGWRAA